MPEQLTSLGEGWLWLGSSLLLAILWTNLAWYFRKPRPGKLGEFVTRSISWRFAPLLFQFLRLLYYIGLPAAALMLGHDVVQLYLGLASSGQLDVWLEWTHELGWAATLGVGTWVLLALGWLAYRRALHAVGEESLVDDANASGWTFLREAAYHEAHWAFYRAVPIFTLAQLTGNDYWGIWTGLALVALETVLNPVWRRGLADPEKAPAQLVRGALAIVSSTLFTLADYGNLWLAITLHLGVSWGMATLRALPPPSTQKHDQTKRSQGLDFEGCVWRHGESHQHQDENDHHGQGHRSDDASPLEIGDDVAVLLAQIRHRLRNDYRAIVDPCCYPRLPQLGRR